jgi:hypothetical protein
MKVRGKFILTTVALLFLWFLAADAYWTNKERKVQQCALDNATALVKHAVQRMPDRVFDPSKIEDLYLYPRLISHIQCSEAMGTNRHWDSVRGMAFWEVIVLAPVVYRFRSQ